VSGGGARSDAAVAVAVAVLGALLWRGAGTISFGPGYDRVGPRVFPYAVAIGMLVLAALLVRAARRGPAQQPHVADEAPEVLDWRPLVPLTLALALYVPLVERVGFIPASGLQFVAVARSFRSRHLVRDAVAGGLLALVVYLALSKGLGLSPPAGPLEGLL
jgi:putative tricarboxylic transport membrane protein